MNAPRRYRGLGNIPEGAESIGSPVGPGGPRYSLPPPAPGTAPALPLAPVVNANYAPQVISLAAYSLQTFLGVNNLRRSLQLQNTGLGALYILFQSIRPTVKSYAANIADITALASQSFWLTPATAGGIPGGSYEPYVPPRNAITLITLATATTGLLLEGV